MSEDHLSKAPIFYALASIRTQPWLLFGEKLPQLQDRIKERYPALNQVQFNDAQGRPQGVMWAFHTADRREGCLFSPDQIVLHTTSYGGYADFRERFGFALAAHLELSKSLAANSMGFRCLDLIEPKEGESLAEYLAPQLQPFGGVGAGYERVGGLAQSEHRTEGGVVRARCWSARGAGMVPADLDLTHALTRLEGQGARPAPTLPEGAAALDTDAIWQTGEPKVMGAAEALAILDRLHGQAKDVFRAAIRPEARGAWR